MSQRKTWTPDQDQKLKDIIQNKKITKWSEVSRALQKYYNILGRSGKQCRERWHNQLDPNIKNQCWSKQQEQLMFLYHNQMGNKWAKIAQKLEGRTDNCVKNHFYSTLRKAIRRLNKFISDNKIKGQFRQISNTTLYKVIAIAEDKFEKKHQVSDQLITRCIQIKERLLQYSKQIQFGQFQVRALIKSIIEFNKSYRKKKSKKKKKQDDSSLQDSMDQEIIEKPILNQQKKTSFADKIKPQKSEKITNQIQSKPFTVVSSQKRQKVTNTTLSLQSQQKQKIMITEFPQIKQKRNLIVGGIKKYISNEFEEIYFGDDIAKLAKSHPMIQNIFQNSILERSSQSLNNSNQMARFQTNKISLESSGKLNIKKVGSFFMQNSDMFKDTQKSP